MPTIFRHDGFRYVIWPNDHLPPHVHVFKAGTEVIIELGSNADLPFIKLNYGMNRRDLSIALLVIVRNKKQFLMHWEETHGKIDESS
jgi:hypothetical protein